MSSVELEKLFQKVKKNGRRFGGKLPNSPMDCQGKYRLTEGGGWTDGFYPGVFLMAYQMTNDEEFLDYYQGYDDFFDRRIQNKEEINKEYNYLALDHDVGFIFLPTSGLSYKLFGKQRDLDICVKAANVLMERFNEKGGFIRAWDRWPWDTDEAMVEEKKGKAIIDSMMNIPLLFQAAEMTGNKGYYETGYRHAKTLCRYMVREDYSTFHQFNFDPVTGSPKRGCTGQGYSDDSCWSRGQAWAVYGFALAARYTKDPELLQTSELTARYFLNHLSGVDMPCWDFKAADRPFAPWDSSAAAICASGLLELWELTGRSCYLEQAQRLLDALEKWCLTLDYPDCEPLLLHGCSGSVYREEEPEKLAVPIIGQPLVFGDYFYLDAKRKLAGNSVHIF